jgi:hypothetical protein
LVTTLRSAASTGEATTTTAVDRTTSFIWRPRLTLSSPRRLPIRVAQRVICPSATRLVGESAIRWEQSARIRAIRPIFGRIRTSISKMCDCDHSSTTARMLRLIAEPARRLRRLERQYWIRISNHWLEMAAAHDANWQLLGEHLINMPSFSSSTIKIGSSRS